MSCVGYISRDWKTVSKVDSLASLAKQYSVMIAVQAEKMPLRHVRGFIQRFLRITVRSVNRAAEIWEEERNDQRIGKGAGRMSVKISVIVPVYNVERYLEECLSSLLNQTEPFYEIILINDGSTDGSGDICKRYCDRYETIKLVHQDNRGQSAARNVGLSLAAGDYIVFVDADDFVYSDMNRRLREELQTMEIEVLYFNAESRFDDSSGRRPEPFTHCPELRRARISGMEYLERTFPDYHKVGAPLAVYKRGFLLQHDIHFPEGLLFEDIYFSLRVFTEAILVGSISDTFYVYRHRENSTTTSPISKKKCLDYAVNLELIWSYISKSDPWQERKELRRIFAEYYLLYVLRYISEYADKAFAREVRHRVLQSFAEQWMIPFPKPDMAFALILRALRDERICPPCMEGLEELDRILHETEREIENGFLFKLRPLSAPGCKVAVYGIGRHTEELLKLYLNGGNQILCDLCFITTEAGVNSSYYGRRVWPLRDIPAGIDFVIVSSKVYQRQMIENLCAYGFDAKTIITLYEKSDVIDLPSFQQQKRIESEANIAEKV